MMEFEIPTHNLHSVKFRFYNREDVLNLSVKELTNAQTFDTLAHPTIGGLYDPALGPTDKDDVCSTCGQNFIYCPGHMGHITLPLPTFNPVYFKTLYHILKGSCFNCHRLAIGSVPAYVFSKKLLLLEHGLLPIVTEVEEIVSSIVEEVQKISEAESLILERVGKIVDKALDGINQSKKVHTKNLEAEKSAVQRDFLSNYFVVRGKCPHCKKKRATLRQEHQSKLLVTGCITPSILPEEEEEEEDENTDMGLTKVTENIQNSIEDDIETGRDAENHGDPNVPVEHPLTPKTPDKTITTFVTVAEARNHLRLLWQKDAQLLRALFRSLEGSKAKFPTDIFFLDIVAVPPSRFRPVSMMNGKKYENPQTANLVRLIDDSRVIKQLLQYRKECKEGKESEMLPSALSIVPGKTWIEKFQNAWVHLQTHVNCVVDSDLDKLSKDKNLGIKQILEKKEGLFRKHMMGKRVNYAARSVISPDPCISTCEIGIPEVFAKKLTYPQPVTAWNIQELRQAVINGPNVHPGACFVINEDGGKVMLSHKDKIQREAIAKQLLTPGSKKKALLDCKQVYRHLKNGDVLLLNRQPTLHRPSIQAHKARVLPGEKTLRLHYANCKAYNADFDGDEMNAHFPQNEVARAEAYTIASTDFQYLVPKDGTPLAGLIQDHMVSGVWLTMRGRFVTKMDYCQLVYTALVDKKGPMKLLPPAMIKPKELWSGKQVLSTILLNLIPKDKKPLNLVGKSKIPEKSWFQNASRYHNLLRDTEDMGESHVIIREGELLCGVLDKGHYGNTPYGLVHCFYELYGGESAGKLLTCLGRLFMNFLQQLRSFTLGVEDILVMPQANDQRQGSILESNYCGPEAVVNALGLSRTDPDEVVLKALKDAHFDKDDRRLRELDLSMKSKTDEIQNKIVRACMPKGLYRLFPQNNLQLMVQSGAKGSSVNCMQISGLLGQIELEGRRPPLMLSGKTLPSFRGYDTSPRAGGFVSGRFLTGIRPQEYFFHCMAGREGLIDTAVKTSRSGYLQRCLVKHLEGIMVSYDMTVRDTDGSVVQFYYGEDSVDISKAGFLNTQQIPFLLENKSVTDELKPFSKKVVKMSKKIEKWQNAKPSDEEKRKTGFLLFCQQIMSSITKDNTKIHKKGHTKAALKCVELWKDISKEDQELFQKECLGRCPDPLMASLRPFQSKGVLPEKFVATIKNYVKSEMPKLNIPFDGEYLKNVMFDKCEKSLVDPGEAVGLLCAQSIGEPSTQMTLNTFHFAGRGEMNVTLGIPRLREILMVASASIKTPALDIPVYNTDACREKAKSLQTTLNKVMLSEVLEHVQVCEYLSIGRGSQRDMSNRSRVFEIRFNFLPHELYEGKYNITPQYILHFMETKYFKLLIFYIKKKMAQIKKMRLMTTGTVITPQRGPTEEMQANQLLQNKTEDNDMSDGEMGDGDAATQKELQRIEEDKEYEEEGEENPPTIVDVADQEDEVAMEMEEGEEEDDKLTEADISMESESSKQDKQSRIFNVVSSSLHIADYKYDTKNLQWCKVKLQFSIMDSKLDLTSLVENDIRNTVLYHVPGISRCLLGEEKGVLHLKTEGINIMEMYKHDQILDLKQLYSNDIHAIASHYGIEAASRVIIKEVQNVFAAYGIRVDYRHLSLLADYMTFEGTYKPFNRIAMETSTSPLQKMTFETTMHFLTDASIQGCLDELRSPSSQLVTGRVVTCGSGSMDIMQPLVL